MLDVGIHRTLAVLNNFLALKLHLIVSIHHLLDFGALHHLYGLLTQRVLLRLGSLAALLRVVLIWHRLDLLVRLRLHDEHFSLRVVSRILRFVGFFDRVDGLGRNRVRRAGLTALFCCSFLRLVSLRGNLVGDRLDVSLGFGHVISAALPDGWRHW